MNNVFQKWTKLLHFHFWPLDALSFSSTILPQSRKKTIASTKFVVWVQQHKESNKYPIYFDKLFVNMAFNLSFLKLLLKNQWALGKKILFGSQFHIKIDKMKLTCEMKNAIDISIEPLNMPMLIHCSNDFIGRRYRSRINCVKLKSIRWNKRYRINESECVLFRLFIWNGFLFTANKIRPSNIYLYIKHFVLFISRSQLNTKNISAEI